ncbi:hypothetical protein [Serratia marcescens]|uniref:hypothetical protein n=1 Tax=Serratia marcescens TaxID=615 RepID=UPI0002B862C1|nr:hypothetical protein [Serratia marcescens]EMF07200.1 hypothetical protein F518_03601 [Serratia marcescens VGH107]
MKSIEASIMTVTDAYVKQLAEEAEGVKRQQRIARGDIAAADVDPDLWALGRHIVGCVRKGRSVRVPSMRGSEWGHVLRALELKRAMA